MSARHRPPVDLARARAAEERLAARVAANPALADRTAAMLAGDLPCPDLDEQEAPPMRRSQTPVNVRLPDTMLARLDALAPLVGTAAELATVVTVTRSDVLRLAVLKGLEQLEAEYAGHPALPGMDGAK